VLENTCQKNAGKMDTGFVLAVITENFINCLLEGIDVPDVNIPSRTSPVAGLTVVV
jgi:hypothetical protein